MSDSSLLDPAGSSLQLSPERAATVGTDAVGIDDRDIAINAWRGFAALLVAYFHCRQITWIGIQQFHKSAAGFDLNTLFSYLTFPIAWGSAGVPIFFVISGYCIHRGAARKLLANPAAPFDTGNFLMRRFARIYPVLLAALVLTFVLDTFSLGFTPVSPKIGTAGPAFVHRQSALAARRGGRYVRIERRAVDAVARSAVLSRVSVADRAAQAHRDEGPCWFASVSSMWCRRSCSSGMRSCCLRRTGSHGRSAHGSPRRKPRPAHVKLPKGSRKLQIAAVVVALLGCARVQVRAIPGVPVLGAWRSRCICIQALDKPMRNSLPVRGFSWLGEFSFSLYIVHIPILILLGSLLFRSALQTTIWASFAFMVVPVAVALRVLHAGRTPRHALVREPQAPAGNSRLERSGVATKRRSPASAGLLRFQTSFQPAFAMID